MSLFNIRKFFCLFFFLLPSISLANSDKVAAWTQQVLMNTLTVDYQNIDKVPAANKKNYTLDAWEAFTSFMGNYVPIIKDNQLSIQPQAVTQAKVVNEGDYSGIHFWRVNQIILLPEVNLRINFSVIVIKANNPPYLIQSLNMIKNQE